MSSKKEPDGKTQNKMSWRKVGSLGAQSRRCFASLPAKAKVESQLPKISTSDSGFIVGSIENYAPISHVIVVVGAGPRHEKAHEKGASHAIRTLSNLSTGDATKFAISRVLVSLNYMRSLPFPVYWATSHICCIRHI